MAVSILFLQWPCFARWNARSRDRSRRRQPQLFEPPFSSSPAVILTLVPQSQMQFQSDKPCLLFPARAITARRVNLRPVSSCARIFAMSFACSGAGTRTAPRSQVQLRTSGGPRRQKALRTKIPNPTGHGIREMMSTGQLLVISTGEIQVGVI